MAGQRTVSLAFTLMVMAFAETVNLQCSVCTDGIPVTESFSNKMLSVPGFPPLPCGSVDATLALLLPNASSPECELIQSLGPLCGCPVASSVGESCMLCEKHQGELANPFHELPFLADMFQGFAPTCEILSAFLQSSNSEEDALCGSSKLFLADYCCESPNIKEDAPPCQLCAGDQTLQLPNRTINVTDFPFTSCQSLADSLELLFKQSSDQCNLLTDAFSQYCGCASPFDGERNSNHCTLCRDGTPVSLPNQPVEIIKNQFGGLVPTCAILESYVHSLGNENQQCSDLQLFLGGWCGCPSLPNHCQFCPGEDGIQESFRNKLIPQLDKYENLVPSGGMTLTCEVAHEMQYQLEKKDPFCLVARSGDHICGCGGGINDYFAADTVQKQAVLAWMPRVSALLSFLGAAFMINDIRKKRDQSTYHHLVFALALYDIISAFAWGLSTLPIPMEDEFGHPSMVYGAAATGDGFCKAQAFLIQVRTNSLMKSRLCLRLTLSPFFLKLGFTSILYNTSLSFYYYVTVVKGWREEKLKKHRFLFHIIPSAIGICLSFGGIPFYTSLVFACYVHVPPHADSWYPIVFLTLAPMFSTIFFATGMMVAVWWKVRQQIKTSKRWRFSFRKRNTTPSSTSQSTALSSQPQEPLSETISNGSLQSNQYPREQKRKAKRNNLSKAVANQAFFYLVGFYLGWSFFLAAFLYSNLKFENDWESTENEYGFYVVL